MAVRNLDLYDLLGPQFLLGFSFPDYIDRNLSVLTVDKLQTTHDRDLIVYSGDLKVGNDHTGMADFSQTVPGGSTFAWAGNRFGFRLTLSRDASTQIDTVTRGSADAAVTAVSNLLQALRPAGETNPDPVAHPHTDTARDETTTDFPGFAFKLEILVDLLNFSLGQEWTAGRLDPVSHRLVPDTNPAYLGKRVQIKLPKAILRYQQGPDLAQDPEFTIDSWGGAGMDTPNDLAVGEVIRMEPSIALHQSGDIGFSVDKLIIDGSTETTPPEILQHFGTSEDWTGFYISQLLFYYRNQEGVGVNFRINDGLFSMTGEVSFEGAIDIFLKTQLTTLSVDAKIFNGPAEVPFRRGEITPPPLPPTVTDPATPPGSAAVVTGSVLQLEISGGEPPYVVEVWRDDQPAYNATTRQTTFDVTGANQDYLIIVTDSKTPTARQYAEYIRVNVQDNVNDSPAGGVGTPADRPPDPRHLPATLTDLTNNTDTLTILHSPAASGTTETLRVPGVRTGTLTIKPGGGAADISAALTESTRSASTNVPYGATYDVELDFPAIPVLPAAINDLTYIISKPRSAAELATYLADVNSLVVNTALPPTDPGYVSGGGNASNDPVFVDQLLIAARQMAAIDGLRDVRVDSYASLNSSTAYDTDLSQNRQAVGRALLAKLGISEGAGGSGANGHDNYDGPGKENGTGRTYRATRFVATVDARPAVNITAKINRPALPVIPPTETPAEAPVAPPTAPPLPDNLPTELRRIGLRVRLERNQLSLLELNGEIDFETALEKKLRTEPTNTSTSTPLLTNAGGNTNPEDGVVDFRAIYTYNTATSEYGVTLMLGSHPDDQDGLFHMTNPGGTNRSAFKDIFGALMIFAPIINSAATSAATDSDEAGGWVALGTSVAVPVAIGATGILRTRRVVLYGGELQTRFSQPGAPGPGSLDVGLVFDYGVEFDIVVAALGIGVDRDVPNPTAPPMKVRYKAIGFMLHHDDVSGGLTYTPVFDTSKGYSLDLSDPSIFSLPAPLGSLFSIAAARIARFNPVTLEIDLVIKADLGVITVDKFKIKIPVDGNGNLQIMPSGVKVNIPATLVGSGFVNIIDKTVDDGAGGTMAVKGVEGGLDLTVVPMKLRVVANLAVTSLRDEATGREGVGVFAGLKIEFPSPVVLGSSGLGLYGIMGLFAMHYRRLEEADVPPTDPIGPALKWLVKAEGEPINLQNSSGEKLWGPSFDKWAFGVGVILGTMDTGFTANFQGMFVLELPGPRILIMVKMKFLAIKPAGVNSDATEITTGIIAVIDLDFNRQTITIGVLIDFEIEEILQLQIPIEIFFNLAKPSDWHLYLGTFTVPISATILNMVRGSAYFMIAGHDITFPATLPYIEPGAPILGLRLPGVAIALGLEASLFWGSRSVGLFLEIGAGFHVGVAFSPFIIAGSMFFRGRLRLFIVNISAQGSLDVLMTQRGTDPFYTYLRGQVCGSIDFWFFSVSACIDIVIEKGVKVIEPPALVNGVYLQSYAPVLVSGQGGDRPIDASLGNAVEGKTTTDLPTVPIDTVIVLQLFASPLVNGISAPYAEPIGQSPATLPDGWIELTDNTKVKYELTALELEESTGTPYQDADKVPVTWRLDRSDAEGLTNGSRMNIDLALFTRVPTTAERALERSTTLRKSLEVQWENLCKQPASAAPVLFTFCGEPLGPSASGWRLTGTALPDPADALRISDPDLRMLVKDPDHRERGVWENLMGDIGGVTVLPARVVGLTPAEATPGDNDRGGRFDPKKRTCVDFARRRKPLLDLVDEGIYVATSRKLSELKRNVFIKNTSVITTRPPLGGLRFDDRLRVDPTRFRLPDSVVRRRFDRFDRTNITVPGGKVGEVNGNKGVLLNGRIAFQFRTPVCRAELNIRASGPGRTITVIAYTAKGKVLARTQVQIGRGDKAFVPRLLVVEGKEISVIVVEDKGVKGVVAKICYFTDCTAERKGNLNCYRALQLPYSYANEVELIDRRDKSPDTARLRAAIKRYKARQELNRRIDIYTGGIDYLRCYVAFRLKQKDRFKVQELNSQGAVLAEHPIKSLDLKRIKTFNDLPNKWRDAALPWRDDVEALSDFLFGEDFDDYEKFTFTLKPSSGEKCARVRIINETQAVSNPDFYLGAAERLHLSEVAQAATIRGNQLTDRETVEDYLSHGEDDRPLLKPNSAYHLTAKYRATVVTVSESGDPSTGTFDKEQVYSFQTDGEPPAELKAYVLGSTPTLDEEYHFFKDALKVVFNDRATLEMYRAYGKNIVGHIRRADGLAVPNSPDNLTTLEPLSPTVLTPYREFLIDMIDGGHLPCTGALTFGHEHGIYDAPFELMPLMAYTFDLQLDPAPAAAPGTPSVPLYRRAFRTSRFADLEDFTDHVATAPVYSMALESQLTGLPAPDGNDGRTDIITVTDVAMETLLTDAGLPPMAGAEQTSIWTLWAHNGTDFRPHAILLDTPEPIWRSRAEPVRKLILDAGENPVDPDFEIWEPGTAVAMDLLESAGGSLVDKFIRTVGGTRTLILLHGSATDGGPVPITIDARQPASDFYALPAKQFPLFTFTLKTKAPWVD